MKSKQKIAFVGAGSMAEAIISGILKAGLLEPGQITVTNHSNQDRLSYLKETYRINPTTCKQVLIQDADIIVLAMKPKDVTSGLSSIAPFITDNQLIISVLAGITINTITELLQRDVAVIRAMPNTSATIGKSATALAKGRYANESQVKIAQKLFKTIGIVTIVNENDLHAITGLSGSGPAYVYYLIESMETAANEVGLDGKVARELILQTIIGAAEMLKSSHKHPSILRKEVTSPGGTTEAGIQVLESFKYKEAMISCIKKATERSTELGVPSSQNKKLDRDV